MIKGKGIYAWILSRCEEGNMRAVVRRLKQAGMTHIIPKLCDGAYSDRNGNDLHIASLVSEAHKEGIQVFPYHYVYGWSPEAEAERVIGELRRAPFDGLVINAEKQYRDLINNATAARKYCSAVKDAYPDLPLILSTYRFPYLHRDFPFTEFLTWCDYNMPQVYWMQANGTVPHQLHYTVEAYKDYPNKPMIPTGAAFSEHGWAAIPQDQKVFIEEVQRLGLKGCNWWEYWHAFHHKPELGQAIIDTPFEVETLEPIEPPTGGEKMYVIEMLGNLKVRQSPNGIEFDPPRYARTGETHQSKNGEPDGQGRTWYKIDVGWIAGYTQWTRITEVEDEPSPEPEPELSIEDKVDRMWEAHPELHD